jgi:hypothetical protein
VGKLYEHADGAFFAVFCSVRGEEEGDETGVAWEDGSCGHGTSE